MPQLSRRAFAGALPLGLIGGSLLGGGLLGDSAARAATQEAAKAPVAMNPFAQIRIGRFTVTALTDGYADMPYDYFPGRSAPEVERAASAQFTARPSGVRFLFNQYLVEDGERRILIDAGAAGSIGQTGQLPQALAALGLKPDKIDAVIVTHMHQDHMGGLVLGGKNNYPGAELYIDRRDITHWTDPAKRSGAPEYLQTSFRMAEEVVRLYPRLQAIDGEREIMRGVSIVDLTGHTPGHIGVRVEDGGKSMIMVSDMIFPVVHPAATDVFFLFEQDRAAAKAMRDRFFPRAASEGALIAATHMPFPGLGRVVADHGEMRWQVADWALQD
ncbi:MBL fold metallo-hydrolase [Rhizobium leguminosarum]|jgi:glyoxylase-like metal-dependent hydrolase (beta-lactamase superfamily II)|uniref:MBL fold metallo-hydrolase n=1 Tax=Rhizobium leguminosarum TaxID=384 RepID=A0A444I0C5_RHILE|nr:MBL fold metallo-hydrolase [Rhizobium leguminosarum]ASS54020.1 MBL fold metallo-hydrolase [Rhizobium leguminosarum bv. viciae]AVC48712.1 metallo-beta-lactamase superfamily protein [Rhizobium leguminosarum bv. viciae]MBB4333012.1 glyoxylase-like metal-dependent hydrolase (beta-lactamase superfamily II) [Rhizobium leguminosarum]MBB4345956.1 glyoxylase-like metal-dependent hydrolase (beta-lactamase superfamily II) [Rhizobium leguminosarum]MBB4358604.1 glyoxylase-like metal-dependent hydrolase 